MTDSSRRRWPTCLQAAVAVGVIAILVPLLYLPMSAARQAAWRTQRRNSLKNVGLGLQNFHDTYKRLPPAVRADEFGRPLCSWRFQIMQFLEGIMRGVDYKAAWDDPVNRYLLRRWHDCYCLTGDHDGSQWFNTNVVAITGPGTPFDEDWIGGLDDMDSDTILAIEIADFDVHWMEPGDLHIDHIPETITQGVDDQGVHVVFADGTVYYLDANVPLEDLKKFFTIEGAKKYDREQVLGPYARQK